MSCQYCSENALQKQAEIKIDSCIGGNSYTQKIPALICKGKTASHLVLDGMYGFENCGDTISEISLEIKFCPFCGEKLKK